MTRAYVGLGSNVNRTANLRAGLAELERMFGTLTLSPVYRSPAVGFDGADFYNLAAGFDTELDPLSLNARLHAIEDRHGRDRAQPRFSDRTLDIDLLLYGDAVMDTPELTLPRPEIGRYAFVLKPLADIAGEAVHPGTGEPLADMWRAFDGQDALTEVPLKG